MPFEIHPDTAPEGVRFAEYFKGMDTQGFFAGLDKQGKNMGVRFNNQIIMCNSRLSLMGAEYAKEQGKFHQYHEAVFRSCFTDCSNIGEMAVLESIAKEVGIDVEPFITALQEEKYLPVLQETSRLAREIGVTAAPTFLIEGFGKITGAQPIDQFRSLLNGQNLQSEPARL